MKLKYFFLFFTFFCLTPQSKAQLVDYIGLSDLHITSLKINYGIMAAGTKYNGVYWHNLDSFSGTDWHKIELDSINVLAVYPHKSGPLGWAIGIGTENSHNNSELVFCSYLGDKPRKLSYGLDTLTTTAITGIEGFPDPTICGETFAIGGRKIYRRYFNDTIWHSVRDLTIEGNFASLKAREQFADVYAGGSEGFAGVLLTRSTDMGNTWQDLFPFCYGAEIDFWGDEQQTIFVTDRAKLLRSTDNGTNWEKVFETDTLMIQKISFSDDGKVFSFAANSLWYDLPRSYLFYSTDNGNTWTSFQLPVNDLISGMDVAPDYVLYIASISDGVFRVALPVSDVADKDNTLQDDFRLYNNYPNPFNSTTKIKYTIPYKSYVTLKIYDVLGGEIKILKNEGMNEGTYEVSFEGEGLVSGVYFYRLQSGSYNETKRMILLK